MAIFTDRIDAGKRLAKLLINYQKQANTIILALPRGGVTVGFEIAKRLHLPLDVFIVRKIGAPHHEELAIGAIAENDICFFNQDLIQMLHVTDQVIQQIVDSEKQELERRKFHYRNGKELPSLKEYNIILVDDGIATGATTKAAITALRQLNPKKIILAVPVAPPSAVLEFNALVEEFICIDTPEPFYGVGMWYQQFPQVEDDEVIQLLSAARNFVSPHN